VTNAQLVRSNERPDKRWNDGVGKEQSRLYRLSDLRCKPEMVRMAVRGDCGVSGWSLNSGKGLRDWLSDGAPGAESLPKRLRRKIRNEGGY
jgi:hypothetical protein